MLDTNSESEHSSLCEVCKTHTGKPVVFYYGKQSALKTDVKYTGGGMFEGPLTKTTTTTTSFVGVTKSEPVMICFDCAKKPFVNDLRKNIINNSIGGIISIVIAFMILKISEGNIPILVLLFMGILFWGGLRWLYQVAVGVFTFINLPEIRKMDKSSYIDEINTYRKALAIESKKEDLQKLGYDTFWQEKPQFWK